MTAEGQRLLEVTGHATHSDPVTEQATESDHKTPPFEITDKVVDGLFTDIDLVLLGEGVVVLPGLRSSEGDELAVPGWIFESRTTPAMTLSIAESSNLDTAEPELQIHLADTTRLASSGSGAWRLTLTFDDGSQISLEDLSVFEHGATWDIPTNRRPDEIVQIHLEQEDWPAAEH